MDHLDGVRVRVPNTTMATALKAIGGVPVTMETADLILEEKGIISIILYLWLPTSHFMGIITI
ncbi:MAG: hypothetical protein LUF92_05735 [Clostridiales bacterium]|nr:hypothetical protein [Clostridiales bacterium]